jgi:DNA gyrase subunit B
MSENTTSESQQSPLTFSLREHVRLRPGMYVGITDLQGLHESVRLILDDFVDEVLVGHCDHIWITLHPNQGITLRNNGRGISTKPIHENKSFLELLMTEAGIKRVNGDYQITGGFFGICLYATNALSAELKIESAYDGFLWQQTYREGIPHSEVIRVRELEENEGTGVTITFRPDFTILEVNEFDYDMLAERARDLAYLLPVTITLRDEREATVRIDEHHFSDSLIGAVVDLNKGHSVLHEPKLERNEWTIKPKSGSEYIIKVDFAFQYTDSLESKVVGFINTLRTVGGFHTDILPLALVAAIQHRTLHLRLKKPFSFEEIAAGLTMVVRVIHPHPSYSSHTHVVLHNRDVCGIVADTLYQAFQRFDFEQFQQIIDKLLTNREALKIK